jgi:hypothetical protein
MCQLDLAVEESLFYPARDEPIAGHRGGVHVCAGGEEVMVSIPSETPEPVWR